MRLPDNKFFGRNRVFGGKETSGYLRLPGKIAWLFLAATLVNGVSPAKASPIVSSIPATPSMFTARVVTDTQDELLRLAGVSWDDLKIIDPAAAKQINEKLLAVLPNSDMFVYYLDKQQAASLGFPLLSSGSADKKTFYIIQEYAIYRTLGNSGPTNKLILPSTEEGATAQGVSVRLIISVKSKNASITGLSIGALTLAAERKSITANISLQTVGVMGKAITEATPMPSELNFTTLTAMYQGMDRIKQAIWTPPENSLVLVRPQLIRRRDDQNQNTPKP